MDLVSILAQEESSGSPLISLGILLLIPAAMYFLMIRPQRRRMKSQQSLQRSIAVGDEVITTSGVYGFITGEDGDKFWLEIDDDVQIRIARIAVQARVNTTDSDTAGSDTAGSGTTGSGTTGSGTTGSDAAVDAPSDDTAKSDGQ